MTPSVIHAGATKTLGEVGRSAARTLQPLGHHGSTDIRVRRARRRRDLRRVRLGRNVARNR
jgi:hypothetical protein